MDIDLLTVDRLKVQASGGAELVRDVSFTVRPGEIMGLVGESGCGKSITALTVAGLLPAGIRPTAGRVIYEGTDLTGLSFQERRALNGRSIGMVYQDALTALNPLMRVGKQIEEVLSAHTDLSRTSRYQRTLETMRRVGLPDRPSLYKRYPHELSGGQRQRVLLAMAIVNRPRLLIADEPTTAIDVVVQRQIIELLKDINRQDGVSILFISHDIKTVKRLCDRLTVLYAGMTAESGPPDLVTKAPAHYYTKMLLKAVLTPERRGKKLVGIEGSLPRYRGEAEYCLFADRCPAAQAICRDKVPPLRSLSTKDRHMAACFMASDQSARWLTKVTSGEGPDWSAVEEAPTNV